MSPLPLAAAVCLVICSVFNSCSVLNSQASAKQLNLQELGLQEPALPLTDQSALICEAGRLLGTGGQARTETADLLSVAGPDRRLILIELVTRVDVDRDRQLDHRELQTLDRLTRQQLLRQLDRNYDRKLSLQELEQEPTPRDLVPREPTPSGYPSYPKEPLPASPPQPETFRNLRRFGIGIQQTPPKARSQPFARAATFGTSPGFRPVTKKSTNRRSEGSCRATSDFYLRAGRR